MKKRPQMRRRRKSWLVTIDDRNGRKLHMSNHAALTFTNSLSNNSKKK